LHGEQHADQHQPHRNFGVEPSAVWE